MKGTVPTPLQHPSPAQLGFARTYPWSPAGWLWSKSAGRTTQSDVREGRSSQDLIRSWKGRFMQKLIRTEVWMQGKYTYTSVHACARTHACIHARTYSQPRR